MKKSAVALLASIALLLLLAVAVLRGPAISGWLATLFGTGEVSIGVHYDAATDTTIRVVEDHEVQTDEELVRLLKSYSRVVIRAAPEAPWQEVVHLMNLCKQVGVEVEFATPEAVSTPRPRRFY